MEYKLTVHIPDGDTRRTVVDTLHARIQDIFNDNDVQIMSPHYVNDPHNRKVVPSEKRDPQLREFGEVPSVPSEPSVPPTPTVPEKTTAPLVPVADVLMPPQNLSLFRRSRGQERNHL